MTPDQIESTIRTRMNAMIGLVLFFLAHYWYVQKDMITFAIKNHMIARQQTQLREFFSQQEDPMFVVTDDGELIFSNPASVAMFSRLGFLEIDVK